MEIGRARDVLCSCHDYPHFMLRFVFQTLDLYNVLYIVKNKRNQRGEQVKKQIFYLKNNLT